jgi:hypothetical protein
MLANRHGDACFTERKISQNVVQQVDAVFAGLSLNCTEFLLPRHPSVYKSFPKRQPSVSYVQSNPFRLRMFKQFLCQSIMVASPWIRSPAPGLIPAASSFCHTLYAGPSLVVTSPLMQRRLLTCMFQHPVRPKCSPTP